MSRRNETEQSEWVEAQRMLNEHYKQQREQSRNQNTDTALLHLPAEYRIEIRSEYHWSIFDESGFRIDYYPTSGKYHVISPTKRGRVEPEGIEGLFKKFNK